MPNKILKIILKIFGGKEMVNSFEIATLKYYSLNVPAGQELDYYSKLVDKFYAHGK